MHRESSLIVILCRVICPGLDFLFKRCSSRDFDLLLIRDSHQLWILTFPIEHISASSIQKQPEIYQMTTLIPVLIPIATAVMLVMGLFVISYNGINRLDVQSIDRRYATDVIE